MDRRDPLKSRILLLAVTCVFAGLAARFAHAAPCGEDRYIHELIASGDDFRAVTLLKEAEFRARPSDEGFACAQLLLGTYLRHSELDVADAWLTHVARNYQQLSRVSDPGRLGAEMAFLFGNDSEVRHRLGTAIDRPTNQALLTFSATLATPRTPPTILCGEPACAALRQLYARPETRSRKSLPAALALGVVPGLGQVYAGRVLSGLGSFLLDGLLGSLATYALHRGERATALAVGGLAAALYFGNFYAGYEAARRENERRDAETIARVRAMPLTLELWTLTAWPPTEP